MPHYQIQDSQTGRTMTVEGDAPPTEQDATKLFATLGTGTAPPPKPTLSERVAPIVDSVAGEAEKVVEPFTPEGMLNQPTRLVGAISKSLGGNQIADPFVAGQSLLKDIPEPQGTGYGAGLGRLGIGILKGFTTPESIVTLPAAAYSKFIQAVFAGYMAWNLPPQTKRAIEVLKDPKASKADKVEATGEPVVSSIFIKLLSKVNAKPTVGESLAPETTKAVEATKAMPIPEPKAEPVKTEPKVAEPTPTPEVKPTLAPALMVEGKPVAGKVGDTHVDIAKNVGTPEAIEALAKDENHVFVKVLNREEAGKEVGLNKPLHSEDLLEQNPPVEPPPTAPVPTAKPVVQVRMPDDLKNAWYGKLRRIGTIGKIKELEEGWNEETNDPHQQHKLELLAERKAEISDERNRGDALQQFFDESSPEMQRKIDAHLEKLNANRKLTPEEQQFDDFLEQQISQRLNKSKPQPTPPPPAVTPGKVAAKPSAKQDAAFEAAGAASRHAWEVDTIKSHQNAIKFHEAARAAGNNAEYHDNFIAMHQKAIRNISKGFPGKESATGELRGEEPAPQQGDKGADPIETLNTASAVTIKLPKGVTANFVKLTDKNGGVAIEPISKFSKYNPAQNADIVKFEVGNKSGKKGEFIAEKGKVDIQPKATKEFEQADVGTESETGLPVGVANKGKAFAPELMEATRRLGSLARYKELLGNIRGKFIKSKERDRIETEDITNQRTMAHELGHAIESILFPREEGGKYVPLGKKFVGKERQFRNELTTVSELMRGKIEGKPHQIAYRRRGEELFADYVSLYVHDPVKASELAPNFTQAFEKTVSGNKEISDVLKQLHEGKVEPVAPEREVKPTGEASEMPGRLPARPKMAESLYDRDIAAKAQDIVADSVRMNEAETQSALIKSTRWQKNVPKVSDRNDVGAFIEGIGNLEKPGDTIEGVKSRMTEPMKQLAKDIRFQTELTRQNINKTLRNYGQSEYLKFLEDYLSHFYVGKQRAISSALNNWIKNSPNAKQRKVPTLREAVELGLKPVTQDPTVTYPIYASMNWRVAASKKMLYEARRLKGQDGEPAIVPASKAPLDWPVSNHPLIQQVYAHETPGGTMLWRGGAAIHPDLFPALQQILEKPTSSTIGKAYDSVTAFSRIGVFAGSLFHDFTMRLASVGAMAQLKNPIRGLVMIGERDPVTGERKLIQSTRKAGKRVMESEDMVRDAVRSGVKLSDKTSDQYEIGSQKPIDKVIDKVNQIPVLGKATRMIQNAYEWRQKGLWRNTHDAYKIMAYQDIVRRGVDKEIAASYMNDAFGGQEKSLMFWADPRTQKFLGRVLLAPDWTLSTLRSIPLMSDAASFMRSTVRRGAAPRYVGMQGNLLRAKFWAAEMAALATGAIFTQYAIYKTWGSDDKEDKAFPWDNETGQKFSLDITPLMRELPGHNQDDLTRHYVNPGKRASEIIRWFYDPVQAATYKLAPPLQEGIKQVSGVTPSSYKGVYPAEWVKDAKASWAAVPERLESAAKMFEPFSLRGNQVALSLPMHKGQTAVEQVYGMVNRWADQSDNPKIKSTYGTKAYFAGAPSTYSNLKKLISTGSYDEAGKEYQSLRDAGHKKEDIEKSFNPDLKFTGKNEEEFKFSLTPHELAIYEAAIEYRKVLQARLKMLEY